MSTLTTSQEPAAGDASIDRGLRSAAGIRWLLFAGGLVVAVSVIRLVAAEWGVLPTAARFLTLAAGALAVFAAGDVTRHRLCLPVAGSALLCLGTALVPLLAWGAAYLGLLEAPLGWPSLAVGLGALLAAADRTLRRVLAYRGGYYTAVAGVLLFALPLLPWLEGLWPRRDLFFLAAAAALGLLLRSASRHVNRFFFHRDRLAGVERPVHWLPFALLILLYGGGMSLLSAFPTHLALPLVFVAVALIDAGEEYYRALIRATGEKPRRWPRRSLALLALGFCALAAALVTAPLDAGRQSLALVASVASLRLLAWGWRYRSTAAHASGLLTGVVAYHAFPALVPDTLRELFSGAIRALGVNPHGPGALSLGDLGMVAQLLILGWFLRRRLTPAMRKAHAGIAAAGASLLLLIGLMDPSAARIVAPAAAVLLAGGVLVLRWKILVPALYQALATSALAWAWGPGAPGGSWSTRSALLLGVVHLFFLGAGYALRRWNSELASRYFTPRLLTWPPLAVAFALLFRAWVLTCCDLGSAGLLALVAAETFLLSALILGRTWLFAATSLALAAGAHSLAAEGTGDPTTVLSLVSQGLMVVFGLAAIGLDGRRRGFAGSLRTAALTGFVACAAGGFLWLAMALDAGSSGGVETFHLALLAALLIAGELVAAARAASGEAGDGVPDHQAPFYRASRNRVRWGLEAGLALAVVWVPLQAGGLAAGMWWTATAAGWLALAVALRAGAEILERRGRQDLVPAFLTTAAIGGMASGAAAIWGTATTAASSPWLPILPGFLASLFFVFLAFQGNWRQLSAALATGLFALSSTVLLLELPAFGPELYCLGPGLALLGLSGLLRRELGESWRLRVFTGGATLLYAMPVLGLLEELDWGWQIVLLLLAVAFGAASFRLRSRSLLIVSTAALVVDLACFLIKLRQTAPLLVWVAGIVFGLGLMATAALLEHRREVLLQRIRIWGRELRSWA